MSVSLDPYIIKSGKTGARRALSFLNESLRGRRVLYALAVLALLLEAMSTFLAPLVVRLTIDSVIGLEAPSVPAPFDRLAHTVFGPEWNGGGLIEPPGVSVGEGAAINGTGVLSIAPAPAEESPWLWRSWLRGHLYVLALAFFACIGLQALFSFTASYLFNRCAEDAAKKMRDRLYTHVQYLPWETLLRAQSGDWLQRCTSDVDTTRRFIAAELPELARTVFLLAWALPVMTSLSPKLTLMGVLVFPLIIVFSFLFHRIVEKVFRGVDEREGVLSSIIQENVTGVRVVRAFARQAYETARFSTANDRFREQVYILIRWMAFYWGFSAFLGIVQMAIVLASSLVMIGAGTITLGLMVLFLTWEQQILWPVRQFGRILADAGKMKVAVERMSQIIGLERETELDVVPDGKNFKTDSEAPRQGGGEGDALIAFEHVDFTYPDGTAVLKDVSFTVKRGEQLAIVGPTGAGKSTLVHLLVRLYEPQAGRILFRGRDIAGLPKRQLRRDIALVLQEGFLYGKNVRENIRMGRQEAGDTLVVEAARKADFHRVVDEFNEGWETMVGERGVTLSGGQRQRLALARALVREAPVLVLDDSLSAVDTETDARIRREALGKNDEGASIVIAHRITTLANADRILVLEKGRVSDIGTHAELVARPGLYQRLARLQEAVEHDEAPKTAV